MSVNFAAFVLGLFGVPIVLLVFGKRLRRRTERTRRAFWGAIVGHLIAMVIANTAGLITAEAWTGDDQARGFAGYWALFVFPVVGALWGGWITRGKTKSSATILNTGS